MQALWMVVAAFMFSLMSVAVKYASHSYSTAEVVAYRGLIGVVILFFIVRWQKQSLRTTMPGKHFWRGLVGVISLWMWFYSLGDLPIALSVTLNYTSPIWLAAFLSGIAWWSHKKRPDWRALVAIVISFVGILLLLHPDNSIPTGVSFFVALVSGVFAALAYLQVREMGLLGEPETRVVFYFSLICALAGALGHTVTHGVWHSLLQANAVWLLAVGGFAALAQIAMTRAYRLGNPLLAANLQYTGILFSTLWDFVLWQQHLSPLAYAGILVILMSGLFATWINYPKNLS